MHHVNKRSNRKSYTVPPYHLQLGGSYRAQNMRQLWHTHEHSIQIALLEGQTDPKTKLKRRIPTHIVR